MLSKMYIELIKRKKFLEKIILDIEKKLNTYPAGRLRIIKNNNNDQYYWLMEKGDTNGIYISKKDIITANELAQKDYDKKALKLATGELKKIDSYLLYYQNYRIEDLYESYTQSRKKLISPVVTPRDQFVANWSSTVYEPLPFEDSSYSFYSASGIHVRSKAEVIIADMLEHYSIPYKYEYPLYLDGLNTVRPDFTCLNVSKRKEYIWEHFGMMDNQSYANKNIKKISVYEQNGYMAGDNMILTFESSQVPLDSRVIKTKIEKYLL